LLYFVVKLCVFVRLIASKDIAKVFNQFSDLMQQIILKLKGRVGFVDSEKIMSSHF
jgi:hypothetical protein